MAVTLVIVDNADTPTGADVTALGGAVTVRHARLTGDPTDPVAIGSGGTILQNGTVGYLLPKGCYWFWGVNPADAADLTPLYPVNVTDGQDSVATRSRAMVADRIRSLNLPVHVYEQWNSTDLTNVSYPAVLLTLENVREGIEKSLNVTDDVGRPVKVIILDRASVTDHTRLGWWELWRQRIERAFHNQQLDMPESVICKVEYDGIIDPSLPRIQFAVSEFVIRHYTREFRGLGV